MEKKWSYLPRQPTGHHTLTIDALTSPSSPTLSPFTRLQLLWSLVFCHMPMPSSPLGLCTFYPFPAKSSFPSSCMAICSHPPSLGTLPPQRGLPKLPCLKGAGTILSNLNMVESKQKFPFLPRNCLQPCSLESLSSSFMAYWLDFMSFKYVLISWSPVYLKISISDPI